MTQLIHKYPLQLTELQTIKLPKGAKIVSVQEQRGVICVWALYSPPCEMENRTFQIAGTGQPFEFKGPPANAWTVQQGGYVWHVFEVVPR